MPSGRLARRLMSGASLLVVVGAPKVASAAFEWVDRGLTLPQLGLAFDLGMGIAHVNTPAVDGVGLSFDAAIGVLDNLEIGLRFGLRMGAGAKATQADSYGRLFDLETYGTRGDLFANPELRVTGRLLDLSLVELGLEGRLTPPFETDSRTSFVAGLPVRFHFGRLVRLDTGIYVPVVLAAPGGGPITTTPSVDLPIEVWFQATRRFFLGPLAQIRVNNDDVSLGVDRGAGLLLGVGLGYQISRWADFKLAFEFPRVNGTPGPDFTVGAGLGLHFD